MPDLPRCRLAQLGAFSAAQAREAGLTRHVMQRLLDTGQVIAVRRGVYVEQSSLASLSRAGQQRLSAVAACLARPGSVVSHHSAALVHGLPSLGPVLALAALTVEPASGRRSGADRSTITRSAPMPDAHVERRGAWLVTTVASTLCDLVRAGAFLEALTGFDFALHRRLTTHEAVEAVALICRSWPGGHRLMPLVGPGHSGAESPYESLAGWQLTRVGCRAIPQVWAYDARGPIGRGDRTPPLLSVTKGPL